jgi:hypothetical protein
MLTRVAWQPEGATSHPSEYHVVNFHILRAKQKRTHREALVLLLTAVSACSAGAQARGASAAGRHDPGSAAVPDAGACTVSEVSAERLRIDGRTVYVEPFMAESNARGDVFLAGRFNLLGPVDTLDHWKPSPEEHAIIGAYIAPRRPPRLVPSPFPDRRLSGFHALPEGDSSWLVVFGERLRAEDGTYGDSATALWAGHFDGWRWSAIEPLPHPPGAYQLDDVSNLAAHGDTVWLALRKEVRPGLIVLQRVNGQWTYAMIDAFLQSPMLHTDTALSLALAGPDQTLTYDGNSLWVWTARPQWRPLRKVVASQDEQVYRPSLSSWGAEKVITWVARPGGRNIRLRAMVTPDLAQAAPPFTVDSATSGWRPFFPVHTHGGLPLWVSDHRGEGHRGEIQFSIYDPGIRGARVIGSFPHDFATPFVVTTRGPGELIVSGGHVEIGRYAVSEIRTFHVECRPDRVGTSARAASREAHPPLQED